MPASLWIDLILLVLLALAAWQGWRRGAVTAGLSFLGVAAGAIIGILVAPHLVTWLRPGLGRLLLAVLVMVGLVAAGQTAALVLAAAVRKRLRGPTLRVADSCTGSAVHMVAVLCACWLLALPLSTPLGPVGDAVRGSRILAGVGDLGPDWLREAPTELTALLHTSGFTDSVMPVGFVADVAVDPPDPSLLTTSTPRAVQSRVLRVHGSAPDCKRIQHGSGFVIAPQRVITNAHVVAGTRTVTVDTVAGTLPATVVAFDPKIDIAVLSVPTLTELPLTQAPAPLTHGANALVVGYPANGPYTAAAARIRGSDTKFWADIYHTGTAERQVYAIRGKVREGDSGGPLIDSAGRVLGMVFGSDESDTGFALTLDQLRPTLDTASADRTAVGTGGCAAM